MSDKPSLATINPDEVRLRESHRAHLLEAQAAADLVEEVRALRRRVDHLEADLQEYLAQQQSEDREHRETDRANAVKDLRKHFRHDFLVMLCSALVARLPDVLSFLQDAFIAVSSFFRSFLH